MEDLIKKLELLHGIAGLAPVPKQQHIDCDLAFKAIREAIVKAADLKQP